MKTLVFCISMYISFHNNLDLIRLPKSLSEITDFNKSNDCLRVNVVALKL